MSYPYAADLLDWVADAPEIDLADAGDRSGQPAAVADLVQQ